jgi:hypothetical protein
MRHILVGCLALITVIVGCSSSSSPRPSTSRNGRASAQTAALSVPGVQRTTTAVDGLRALRDELTKTRETVGAAAQSLQEISTAQGDLLGPFQRFMSHKDVLDQEDQRLSELAEDMRARARDYITNWEVEVYGVEDAELRKQAEVRRSQVRANYGHITDATRSLRDAMAPFRKQLADLNTFLANDLTPSGVHASAASVQKATNASTEVQQRIDKVIDELDRVAQTMTPAVTQPEGDSSRDSAANK